MSRLPLRSTVFFGFILFVIVMLVLVAPPRNFPTGELVQVEGENVAEIAEGLAAQEVIRAPSVMRAFSVLFGVSNTLKAGSYVFERSIGTVRVLRRLAEGRHGDTQVRVRLPEGATRNAMANVLADHVPNFDSDVFLSATAGQEGRLFPNTYFFLPETTEALIAERLLNEFDQQIEPLAEEIASSTRALDEIVIMASIIEREVADPDDRRIVAGILWNRIDIGMALQVDAPFYVLFGKTSEELTQDDLATTSPYNTYTHVGLPPAPIGNPGLDAIDAALHPAETDYLYYLSDSEGNTYYAEDLDGHIENRRLYLD